MSPPLRPPIHQESAASLAAAVRRGSRSALEVTEAHLSRIDALDPSLGAFLHVDPEGARAQARAIDEARRRGEPLGPLAGVPVAIKDNLSTLDQPTTCASRLLEGYRPPYDAEVVVRLRAASAVVLGKSNLDEFGMGSSTERSAFQTTENPWDRSRVPGGSSGGSAAAVGAGLATVALGSDTGGSVRQPASFCGVAGLCPTYGRISRYGLVAFASSLDRVGPIARSVEDLGLLLELLAGHDPKDATSARRPAGGYTSALEGAPGDLAGVRIGLDRWALEEAEETVRAAIEEAAVALEERGAEIREVTLPFSEHALSAYYLIAAAEASSNLARFDGVRFGRRERREDLETTYRATRGRGFGPEVKRRILLGTYALRAGYADRLYQRALALRARLIEGYRELFRSVDALLSPTSPGPAFPLGACLDDPLSMYRADRLTLPSSLAGLPALSLPVGLAEGGSAGLPIGAQLIAPAFEEASLLRIGRVLESAIEETRGGPLRSPLLLRET